MRTSMAALAALWALFGLLFYASYLAACEHLTANRPSQMQNRSELQVFFAPPVLRAGEEFSETDLRDYFNELGFIESETNGRGRYSSARSSISFNPVSNGFSGGRIEFSGTRIARIYADGHSVDRIELEPIPMRSFVRFVNDDSLREQRVRRIVLSADSIPQVVADAVTSAEDTRFFEHHGIDVLGMGWRVLSRRGGGSSITQQLIKNNVIKGAREEFWQRWLGFLPPDLQRKLMEIPFAIAAEEIMAKNEILAAYLSMTPLGASEGVELHGFVSAGREYFGKAVSDLTLAEAATLAGMIHRPSHYVSAARRGDYTDLIGRRNRILEAIGRNHPEKYSADAIDKAKAASLQFVFESASRTERPPDAYSRLFSAWVAAHLPENLSEIREAEGNLQIYTTLDYRLQKRASEISDKATAAFTRRVHAECQRLGKPTVECRGIRPQVALVAMEAESGDILTMYGGNSLDLNFAAARRSPASAIKPFYYLLATESGMWKGAPFGPGTVIDPATDVVAFRPESNIGLRSTVAVGLAKSYNFHAVAAAESAGLANAVRFVGRLTNSAPEATGVSAIGGSRGSETSLLDMVAAYTVFANRGRTARPSTNLSYVLNDRRTAFGKTAPIRVSTVEAASAVNEMMKLAIRKGGTAPDFLNRAELRTDADVSGKTGSGMVADLWFFAVTGKLVVGIWAGLPSNEIPLGLDQGFSGGKTAAPIAADFLRELAQSRPELLE